MAIEYSVIMYGCKFKCGQKHLSSKKLIEEHELNCWYNPVNQTCKTCKFEKYFCEPWGWVRECSINNITEAEYYNLEAKGTEAGNFVKPKINCNKWNAKLEEENLNGK